jgi:hypothetical protein
VTVAEELADGVLELEPAERGETGFAGRRGRHRADQERHGRVGRSARACEELPSRATTLEGARMLRIVRAAGYGAASMGTPSRCFAQTSTRLSSIASRSWVRSRTNSSVSLASNAFHAASET